MIHEKQIRQFCAIHTVNNLLQLSSEDANGVVTESDGISASDDEGSSKQTFITTEWRYHGRLIYRQRRRSDSSGDQCNASSTSDKKNFNIVATQSEFNEIAEDFTNRELRLMEGSDPMIQDSNNESATEVSQQSGRKLSTMQRLRSNYGTPVFGNYSVEVLETALNRRGVKIEYYRIQENARTVNNVDEEEVIGFIVHEEETKNSLSYLRRLGSYIPLVSHMCKGGRHWWAITGLKRMQISDATENENDTNHVEKQVKEEKEWFLIDSNADHIPIISSDDDLIHYLSNVQGRGALIFRCFVSKNMT